MKPSRFEYNSLYATTTQVGGSTTLNLTIPSTATLPAGQTTPLFTATANIGEAKSSMRILMTSSAYAGVAMPTSNWIVPCTLRYYSLMTNSWQTVSDNPMYVCIYRASANSVLVTVRPNVPGDTDPSQPAYLSNCGQTLTFYIATFRSPFEEV